MYQSIKTMKTGKAVGDDGISVEMLRALGDYAIDKLTDIEIKYTSPERYLVKCANPYS